MLGNFSVYYCWVGDSRAIVCRNGVAKRLTFEHSLQRKDNPLLDVEMKRIKDAGGEIYENNGIIRNRVLTKKHLYKTLYKKE